MDGLHMLLFGLLGVVSCSYGWISEPVVEVEARPGDNITLYCDCKLSKGVYIAWFRNCSHENQPSLVLKLKLGTFSHNNNDPQQIFPRFRFVRNFSSDSYDLLITNVTDSDEGLYYCGTEHMKVEVNKYITPVDNYKYGNKITRIKFNASEPHHYHTQYKTPQDCSVCWLLLFSLCPTFAVLASVLSSFVVWQLCSKKARELQIHQQKPETRGQISQHQEEDVCYAALEVHQASQRPKKKRSERSDFSTYSAINTSRM